SMKRNLARHKEEELKQGFKFEQWQSAKLRDLERFRKENQEIIGKYDKEIEELIAFTLVDTYRKSQDNVVEFIKEIKNKYVEDESTKNMFEQALENIKTWQEVPTPRDEVFFRMNDDKFNALIETVENDFKNANAAVLRRMDDVYRQTVFRAQVHYNTGTVSLEK